MKLNKLSLCLLYRKAKDTFDGLVAQNEYVEQIQIGKKLLVWFYI